MPINAIYAANSTTPTEQELFTSGTVTVQTDAFVVTATGDGFKMHGGPWSLKVDGIIEGNDAGIEFVADSLMAIKNSTVTVGTEGVVAGLNAGIFASAATDITNAGSIFGNGDGVVVGGLGLSTSKAITLTNAASGVITGVAGAGIASSDQAHTLVVKNQGQIVGATGIEFSGAFNLTNSGTIDGDVATLNPGGSFAAVIVNSGTLFGELSTSAGDDKVTNSGVIVDLVYLEGGKNTLTNSGAIWDGVGMLAGDDTFINSGSVWKLINLGDGKNTMTNSGVCKDNVVFGFGNDILTNSKSIEGDVYAGDGLNKVTNSGTIGGTVNFGNDADTFTDTGSVAGSLRLGDGVNQATVGGTLGGDIIGGSGNDTVTITGHVAGVIDLGDGINKLTGGNSAEQFDEENGNDTAKLGGGDDVVYFHALGLDNYDGGAGSDVLQGGAVTGGVVYNLGATSFIYATVTYDPTSITTTGGGPVKVATIKNFESVRGSSGFELMVGGAAGEFFDAQDGNDVLVGRGGADRLRGGLGDDTFLYLSISDSGVTKATQDIIDDFVGVGGGGADMIDLKGIDANTKLAGDQDFTLIAANSPFTMNAGELRVLNVLSDQIVQGDVNGDGKADFSIRLVGASALLPGDFNL
jgi:hypothetical protein